MDVGYASQFGASQKYMHLHINHITILTLYVFRYKIAEDTRIYI